MSGDVKLVFAGSMGAGKTTAIRAISQIEPILTDVINTVHDEHSKAETTVAMEYGEVTLPNGGRLRLYGTPGQERFSFLWPIIARGALGVVILIDNSRPSPIADLRNYLHAFNDLAQAGAVVVAVGRTEQHPLPTIADHAAELSNMGCVLPVMPADVRRREDVLEILQVLFTLIESQSAESQDVTDLWRDFALSTPSIDG